VTVFAAALQHKRGTGRGEAGFFIASYAKIAEHKNLI
jgi:hypothetical protein